MTDDVHFLIACFPEALDHYGHIMRHLIARGHAVHLWTMEPIDPALLDARVPGLLCHRLPLERVRPTPLGGLRTIARALRLAAQPASVFTLWSLQTKLLCGLPLRAFNRPCIFLVPGLGTVFTSERRRFRAARHLVIAAYRWMFRGRASRVLVLNRDDLAFMTDVIGVPRDRVFLMHGGCGVDPHRYPFAPLPTRRPRAVLVPARLIREKGIFEAARASRLLCDRGVAHEMWFSSGIDPGNPLTLRRAEARALPAMSPAIRVLGRVREMPPVYQAAYAVCLPTYREGVPTALVEASATGRPIVTTDAIGPRDLIRHGETGLRVPIGDVHALADALERVLTDDDLADRLRRSAHAHYLQHGTIDATLQQALPAFASLGVAI